MGRAELGLPFERGQTYGDNALVTMTSTYAEHLLGKLFKTTDSSGRDLILRCVRADAALTNVGGKCVAYTTAKVGRNVSGYTGVDGELAAIIDDEYSTTFDVAQYDIFYVVEEGDVDAVADATVNAAEQAVMADASGDGVIVATAGKYVIGFSNEASADGVASIHVCGGLKPSDAATA